MREHKSFSKKTDVANAFLSEKKRIELEAINLNTAVTECVLSQLRCSWALHQIKRIGIRIKPLVTFFCNIKDNPMFGCVTRY